MELDEAHRLVLAELAAAAHELADGALLLAQEAAIFIECWQHMMAVSKSEGSKVMTDLTELISAIPSAL